MRVFLGGGLNQGGGGSSFHFFPSIACRGKRRQGQAQGTESFRGGVMRYAWGWVGRHSNGAYAGSLPLSGRGGGGGANGPGPPPPPPPRGGHCSGLLRMAVSLPRDGQMLHHFQ